MSCADYANRPQQCREYTCGRPCEGCGSCCKDALVALPVGCSVDGDADFLALHGVTVREDGLYIETVCKNYIPVRHRGYTVSSPIGSEKRWLPGYKRGSSG